MGITLAADEIFDGESPHLVLVDPQSLLIVELSRQDHRDALTWGLTFLECAQWGMKIERVVSDGAQGLKKGIVEAELGMEHQLDLFHTIREALRAQKQLEKGATPNSLETCLKRLGEWKAEVVKQIRQTVRWLLGNAVRASSLVETVNSWLRPFLWRRKGNGRGIYNLLRCCWNTHRFRRGKRRGKTPFQLAGIEVSTEDWLELLGFAPKSVKSVN